MASKGKQRQDKHKAKAQEMKARGVMRSVDPDRNANPGNLTAPGSAANRRRLQGTDTTRTKKPARNRRRFGL